VAKAPVQGLLEALGRTRASLPAISQSYHVAAPSERRVRSRQRSRPRPAPLRAYLAREPVPLGDRHAAVVHLGAGVHAFRGGRNPPPARSRGIVVDRPLEERENRPRARLLIPGLSPAASGLSGTANHGFEGWRVFVGAAAQGSGKFRPGKVVFGRSVADDVAGDLVSWNRGNHVVPACDHRASDHERALRASGSGGKAARYAQGGLRTSAPCRSTAETAEQRADGADVLAPFLQGERDVRREGVRRGRPPW